MIRKEFQLVLWSWISIPVWYQIYATGKGVILRVNSVPTELRRKDNACVCVCVRVHVLVNSTVLNIVKAVSSVTLTICMYHVCMQIYAIGHTHTYSTFYLVLGIQKTVCAHMYIQYRANVHMHVLHL